MARVRRFPILSIVLWFCISCPVWVQADPTVVINELHTDPDVKTELVEFVELHNYGTEPVDISGWSFTDGIFYVFPDQTVLPAGGYVIVGQNPAHILADQAWPRSSVPESVVLGPYGGKLSNEGERIVLCDADGAVVDEVAYQLGFPWPTVGDPATGQPGTGRSMQLVNPLLDNDLAGSWRSGSPTPAARNQVWADNTPPHIRQVEHSPKQPKSGEPVTITAKITDPDGIQMAVLTYQVVLPGQYIALHDPDYSSNWTMVDMHDDGLEGDAQAGDDIFTVQLPGTEQVHRGLVRYRIFMLDGRGANLAVPYADDPQPNFAFFVYDGVPAWSGAIRPGAGGEMGEVVEYGSDVLDTLPVYHLISKRSDVEDCHWRDQIGWTSPEASDFKWRGTLIYDGHVYDHIRYRLRGGVWRYAMGKNMWKFDFNRGHYFQARDDYGRKYETTWDKLNFSACIQQGDYQHRGEQGMFEAAAFKLFNLMGVEAPKTHWLHLRVIDEVDETGATQYDGDFWGLYMAIEQPDGRFLNEHGLPDGNLYKMESGTGDLNNQGPTHVTDRSDLSAFQGGYRSRPPETWWRENVNLAGYYGYRCVVEGVHHGDIAYGKNWFFYLNPETQKWSMLPWDLDLTWANNMYGSGEDDFKSAGRIFSNSNLSIEYQNRLREFHDLLYNADQLYQLLDEMANIIDVPTGGPTFVEADRAMWDYNPIMTSGYVNSGKAGRGRFYQRAATRDFRGMVQIMKDYVVSSNRAFDTYSEDPAIPQSPIVTGTGPAGFPLNGLTFRTSPFSDPQGTHTFASMQWRLGAVEPGSQVVMPTDGGEYVFVSDGAQWKYFKGLEEPEAGWRDLDFDDSDWLTGGAALGFGEAFIMTNLSDMRGNYSTVYLRKSFDVAGLSALDRLVLELKYDDGINVWINGTLVFQDNVLSAELPHDATAISAIEITDFISYDLGAPDEVLVEGTNVIAIQLLNASLSGSSDCFVDVRLSGEETAGDEGETPGPPATVLDRPGRYEIEPVWESDELTEFNSDIRIPASVVRVGQTYRVRCRMKDTTGRWSHWSAPVQFMAGEPVPQGTTAYLRITELMYNPVDAPDGGDTNNDDFEFIELQNTGPDTLDLGSVSFTEGVTFDFGSGDITALSPGEFVLVVKNRAAFESRYGSALSGLVAGEYSGRLSNGGETIRLEDFWDGKILDFEYSDSWYDLTDGRGHSLVVIDPVGADAGAWGLKSTWQVSVDVGGSPGAN